MKQLQHRKRNSFVIIGATLFSLAGYSGAQPNKSTFTPDAHTIMLLQPGANGTMTDAKSTFTPNVKGATTVDDPQLGTVLQFGDAKGNDISVKDDGKIDFSHGMTLEMMIQLQQADTKTPNPGGSAFVKLGSFYTSINNGKFLINWIMPPTVTVAPPPNIPNSTSYPERPRFPGHVSLLANQWVHLTFSYNPALRVVRAWINGEPDQKYYLPDRDIPGKAPGLLPLMNEPRFGLSFMRGMQNIRVGEIRVSDIARAITPLTPFETYILALPYRKKPAVIIDHIDANQLPLDVAFTSDGKVLKHLKITDTKRQTIFYDPPQSKGQYPLTITATLKGKEVYSRSADVYAGDNSNDPVHFDKYNRFIINGKPIFPLFAYHAFMGDIPLLAKMGFNMILPRYTGENLLDLNPESEKGVAIARQYSEIAMPNHMYLGIGGGRILVKGWNPSGVKALSNDPALGLWYGADEPGMEYMDTLRKGYVAAKQITRHPLLVVINKSYLFQRAAEVTDIVGADSYPIPVFSLRAVADATKHAIKATDGLKPVFTAIPQYGSKSKHPTLQELRCMGYLAIVSGANALAIYAWDDRNAKTLKGWYTKEHPEDLKILSDFMGEMKQLRDNVLLIPNSSRKMAFTPQNQALHVALKEGDKETYLLLVNDSRAAEESMLSIDGIKSADGADVFGSANKITIRDGKLHVQLPPLGVGVYKLSNIK